MGKSIKIHGSNFKINPKSVLVPPSGRVEISEVSISKETEFYIHTLAERNSQVTAETRNPAESAFVIAEILKHAKKEVKIYCPTLTDEFSSLYNLFYIDLHEFLRSGKTLKIAVQNPEKPVSALYDILARYSEKSPTKVEIKVANDAFHKNMDDVMKKRGNFMVDDKNAFRFELNASTKPFQKSEVNTPRKPFHKIHDLYSFNNEEISKKLNAAFDDKLFNACPSLI